MFESAGKLPEATSTSKALEGRDKGPGGLDSLFIPDELASLPSGGEQLQAVLGGHGEE